ncbi:uncharacterized protein M6B38_308590 [Iris pallida]|uniref:Uncharacterized protein n=1 Tax=Iris pallida TaxID=29817 RepID=A0AAX6HM22_IRIPA|nr:uncharacterized protein M6B38_308590 [Iris pallida]
MRGRRLVSSAGDLFMQCAPAPQVAVTRLRSDIDGRADRRGGLRPQAEEERRYYGGEFQCGRPSAPTFSSSSRGHFSSSLCCIFSRHQRVPSSTRDRARGRPSSVPSARRWGTHERIVG